MARMENGILGGFVGKLGNVIGYRYKGQYYIRQLPRKSDLEPSLAQKAQQAKFAIAMAFLQGLRPLFQQMPDRGKKRITAFNYAFSKVIKYAVSGSYPEYSIDYQSVEFNAGTMSAGSCHRVRVDSKQIAFSACLPALRDQYRFVTLLVFNVTKQTWLIETLSADTLVPGASIELPCNFVDDQVETWMFLSTEQFKKQSPTIYTGSHTIPGHAPCSLNL